VSSKRPGSLDAIPRTAGIVPPVRSGAAAIERIPRLAASGPRRESTRVSLHIAASRA